MRLQATLEGAECLRRSDAKCKVFQARGAAIKNARSPIVVRHENGATRAGVDDDRSRFLESMITIDISKKICSVSKHTRPRNWNTNTDVCIEVNRTICDEVTTGNDLGIFASLTLSFGLDL